MEFISANGHNYVAKLKGAVNKTEPAIKSCRKRWDQSLDRRLVGKASAVRSIMGNKRRMVKYQLGLYVPRQQVGVGGTAG